MASQKTIDVQVAKLYGAWGRQTDTAIFEGYNDALSGDACNDYQLRIAVAKAIAKAQAGDFPPIAGELRALARSEPRDPDQFRLAPPEQPAKTTTQQRMTACDAMRDECLQQIRQGRNVGFFQQLHARLEHPELHDEIICTEAPQ